jgi:hypothetical protein
MEANSLITEIDLTADQTVRPQWIDLKAMSKQADRAAYRSSAYEDHHSLGMSLEIGLPHGGKGTALGSILNADCGALPVGADVAAGLLLKAG